MNRAPPARKSRALFLEHTMAIRVSPPAESHNDTTARFKRSLAEAFPSGTHRIAVPCRFPTPNRPGPWLISALLAVIALALAGCSGAEAQVAPISKSELNKAKAASRYCAGMTPVWLDESTVECFREKP